MLRNRGIRTKLLAVLSLPVIVLLIAATVVSLLQVNRAQKAAQVAELARGAETLGQLVSDLQSERAVSQQFLEKRPVEDELKAARQATDTSLVAVRKVLTDVDIESLSPQAVAALQQSSIGHERLADLRRQIDAGFIAPATIGAQYATVISYDILLPQRIGDALEDRVIGSQLAAYSAAQLLAEIARQEQQTGVAILSRAVGTDPSLTADMIRFAAQDYAASQAYRLNAAPSQEDQLDTAVFEPSELRGQYRDMASALTGLNGEKLDFSPSDWRAVANPRIDALSGLAAPIAENTARLAEDRGAAARTRALLVLLGGVTLVLLVGGLGILLARNMTRPLRRLTTAAAELSAELPKMVERMATPGEGPDVELPDIQVTSNDEVGQLARAFIEVNETTVRVAEEQAALRASIAEMFVNVARRNHVLLSRQLSFIDQLERTEENPDTLDNLFRLDHLATRMRRNAESLIVLAGVDAGRRLRRPMPLSDVIRTAVSEIERYDRVDLSLQADPPLVGHVALTTAHMIAELLENATQFSNPDTRVITSTAFSANGVRVTITDLGLGMTWDEITDANHRIANPPVTDVVGSQRLGFYVVGRLARRLDAAVSLRPGRTQGTVVVIDLPPALFVPGSVVDLPAPAIDEVPPSSPTPDTSTEDGATLGATLAEAVAGSGAQSLHAPESPAAESGSSAGTGLLPRRGGEVNGATALQPRVPVTPVPATMPDLTPVARDASGDDDGASLPRRSRGGAEPVAPVPVAEPAASGDSGPRSGIFSGFRSRRAVDESAPVEAVPVDLPLERPAGVLEDEPAAEFVPVLEESTPLPSRGALPARGARAAVEAEPAAVSAAPVAEEPVAVAEPVVAEPVFTEPTPEVAEEPAPFVPSLAPVAEEEPVAFVPSFAPVVEDEPQPQPVEPVLALEPEPAAPAALSLVLDEPVALVEPAAPQPMPQPSAVDTAVFAAQPEPEAAPPAALEEAGTQARSALSELAREPEPVAEVAPPAPQAELPVRPAFGAPSMDILPTRGKGRGLRRKHDAPEPVRPPVAPLPASVPAARVRPDQPVAAPPAPTPTPAGMFAPRAAPVADVPSITAPPRGAAPEAADAPVPAPSSLFAAPRAVDEAPTPTPAIPALAAAQSLRERSAMASEALSELSSLSSYSPQTVEQAAPLSLTRRTPLATPAGQAGQAAQQAPEEPLGARRGTRNAADVRSMLSGFRAGVERGRTSPANGVPASDTPEH